MDHWPTVTFGGEHEPYIDRVVDAIPYITHPKTVAAYGAVNGYQWSLVLFKKEGDPEDEEPMMPGYRTPPAQFEFFVGDGDLGGGGGPIEIREGAYIDTTGHTWPTNPPIIGYSIFATDEVDAIKVAPDGVESRTFKMTKPLEGFSKLCVFFAPYLVPGVMRVLDEAGRELRRRDLFTGDIPAGAIIGGGD